MKKLTTPQRLIVAADFKPDPLNRNGARWVRNQVLDLADSLADLGVCLKVNSALRACGYDLIEEIRGRGLEVFADLKLVDIPQTLETDGAILRLSRPNLVTVMCAADTLAMHKLSAELPDTEVLGVTVLSSIEEGAQTLFGASISSRVISYADMALRAGISGLIASPKELRDLRGSAFSSRWRSLTAVTPGIRPSWSLVEGDDQNPDRVMTPAAAIRAGADRIVVGRPIIKAENARVAALRTLEEIESAMVAA